MTGSSHSVKLWLGLGLASSLAATTAQAATPILPASKPSDSFIHLAANNQGEGSEGAVISGAPLDDDGALLTQLALIEGHTTVGLALLNLGDINAAKTHMQHPSDEIYAVLRPLLKVREQSGFATELDAMSKAVELEKPQEVIAAVSKKLYVRINRNKPKNISARTAAKVVSTLIKVAAEEYAIAVKGGKIVNNHEYQDAWGFTEGAIRVLNSLNKKERAEHAKDIDMIEKEITGIANMWPDITGKKTPTRAPKEMAAAAARVELIANSIK